MKEIWKDVVGYEGYYKISSFGNVYSIKRDRLLKPYNTNYGYLQVDLSINGKRKALKVHRIVSKAFIKNTDNKPQVNHKDEDKTNNNINNLEWVTAKENNNWGTRNKRIGKKIKVVYQDDTYEFWESAAEFEREFGIIHGSVNNALRGRQKTCYGMRFEYA